MKLKYVILYVADVAKTVQFYQDAFAIELSFMHEGHDYAELTTGETTLALSSRDLMKSLGKTPVPATPDAPTFELAFESHDVAASQAKALQAGAHHHSDIEQTTWGQTLCYVSDLDGYLIEICSPITK